ncbi:MAG: 50S ribosomal protein L10 [Candidatus Moranbacteria bacterium]|nr:50S ribosomal protein L10 [Candidatus Moranbacteria bacterium]
MLTRQQKHEIVDTLTQNLKDSKSVVFVDFRGLSVKEMTSLKRELKKENSNLSVVKKSLIAVALKNAGIDMNVKGLEGQIAVSIATEDEVSSAKIISKFAKTAEGLKIIGGVLGDKEMSEKEVNALAKLPSKEELLSRLVGSLKSPMSGLVNVLQGNQKGLVYVIKAIADSKK